MSGPKKLYTEEEIKFRRRESVKKYKKSPKGRLQQSNYRQTDKHKETYRKRFSSPKHRANHILSSIKRRAQLKDLAFNLTQDWIESKLKAGVCEVSGIPFQLDTVGTGCPQFYSPSVDRIDNAEGYTESNCRVVLNAFNSCKGIATDKDVSRLIAALVENGF